MKLNFNFNFNFSSEENQQKITNFNDFLKAINWDWSLYPTQQKIVNFANKSGVKILMTKRYLAKTDIVTILITAYQLHTKPEKTHLLIGSTYELAKGWIEVISEIIKLNPDLFPNTRVSKTRIRTKYNLKNKDPSISIGTLRTALRGKHPNRIVLDDLLTLENDSRAMKDLAYKKYTESLSLAITGAKIDLTVIGNPVSNEDLYSTLRNTLPQGQKLEIWNNDIDPTKEPLIHTDIDLLRANGMREYEIQANFFGKIVSRGSNLFDYLKRDDVKISSNLPSMIFIDPNKKTGDKSDYTAFTVAQIQPNNMIHVTGYITKSSLRVACEEFKIFVSESDCIDGLQTEIYYEDIGLGDLGGEIIEEILGVPGIGISYSMKKEERIFLASTLVNNLIVCNNNNNMNYYNQIVNYSMDSKHDDAPDSLASCLETLRLIEFKNSKPNSKHYK